MGLGGVYGADMGLLWGGCGLAMGLGVGLAGILCGWVWGRGGFYGAGWDSTVVEVEAH